MGRIQRKWSDEQKEAIVSAIEDRGVAPYERVLEIARAGLLPGADGKPLEPFDMPRNTMLGIIKDARRKRRGRARSALTDKPHRDAVEELRRRFIACVDTQLADIEKQRAKPGNVDLKRLRDVAGLIRDAAAMPDRNDPRPNVPGSKNQGRREPEPRDSQLRRELLADVQRSGQAAPDAKTTHTTHREHATPEGSRTLDDGVASDEDGEPGSLAHELAAPI